MVLTHTHANGQGQRSQGSKVRVKTDRQTDRRTEAIALPLVLMRSVTSCLTCFVDGEFDQSHQWKSQCPLDRAYVYFILSILLDRITNTAARCGLFLHMA